MKTLSITKLAAISFAGALLFEECAFWLLAVLGDLVISFLGNSTGDAGLFLFAILLGFGFRPIIYALLASVIFLFLAIKKTNDINHRSFMSLAKVSLVFAFVVSLSAISAVVISAAETSIPLTEVWDIFLEFIF